MRAKARAMIVLMLSDVVKPLIKSQDTPKKAWDALEQAFHAQSNGRKFQLRQEPKELRKKKTEDVLSFVTRAEQLSLELQDPCNEVVSEDVIVHSILDGPGPTYKDFVRHVRFGTETFTISTLLQRLLYVEMTIRKDEIQSTFNRYQVRRMLRHTVRRNSGVDRRRRPSLGIGLAQVHAMPVVNTGIGRGTAQRRSRETRINKHETYRQPISWLV
jgi:hypothetical protein